MSERRVENSELSKNFIKAHHLLMERAAYGAMGLAFAAVVLTVGGMITQDDQENKRVNYISDSEYRDIAGLKALQYTPKDLVLRPSKISSPDSSTSIDYNRKEVRQLMQDIVVQCGREGNLPPNPGSFLLIHTIEPDCLNILLARPRG